MTILLPAMFTGEAATTPLPRETSMVTIPFPVPVGGRSDITLASWQIMLGLALLIPALVIGAGLTLAVLYIILSRLVANTTTSRDYQESTAALQKQYNDQVARMRETRPVSTAPESTWRRWSVITTALSIIMFVAFLALLSASLIFPDSHIVRNASIFNVGSLLVLIATVITLIALAVWLRSDKIAALNRTDSLAIPWDFIAVVITGLLVVGLGLGVVALVNAP